MPLLLMATDAELFVGGLGRIAFHNCRERHVVFNPILVTSVPQRGHRFGIYLPATSLAGQESPSPFQWSSHPIQ